MKKLLLAAILCSSLHAGAQLYIDNATFFIENGAVVTVQGDVFTNTNIQANGTGKIRLAGTTVQNINLNGFDVPNLQVDNASANVVMTGAGRITTLLEFTNGKIQLGNFDLTLASTASVTGAGAGKFAETNGTGVVKKLLAAAGSTTIPVGSGSTYTPVDFTATGGTYSATSFVSARAVNGAHPNKHPRSTDYLKSYWKLNNNIAGATITAVGNYANPASVTGSQADIVSMYHTGTAWVKGTSQAATSVTAPAGANTSRDLYGMNKFLLVLPKIFLEGPFDQAMGLMKDALRSNNQIPPSDPYRTTAGFSHVSNTVVETVNVSVFNDQGLQPGGSSQNNIVDWIYLELRSNGSPSTVLQTRSALLQRDGDIVDIDGTSEIYFKNLDPANYHLSVRHRNHLGVRTNTALALLLSPVAKNFTTAVSAAYSDAAVTTNLPMKELTVTAAPNVWTMFASNANADAKTTKIGPAAINDYSILLGGLNNALGYYRADYNMDGKVLKTGPAAINDYSKLLNTLSSRNTVTQHNN